MVGKRATCLSSPNKEKPQQHGAHDEDFKAGLNMATFCWSVVLKGELPDKQYQHHLGTCWENKYFWPHPSAPESVLTNPQ